jgi:peroxiredoxin
MAATSSTMKPLGTRAPAFQLTDAVSGRSITLDSFSGTRALLVMFLSRHCPFVQHVKAELARIGHDYPASDVSIVAISSNDIANYPEDAPEKLKEMALETNFRFPFCFDGTQETAKAYTAACTPDFFLYDQDRKLVYRGQLDDSRPGNGKPVDGRDLRAALDAVLAGRSVHADQKPSIGCNIKMS